MPCPADRKERIMATAKKTTDTVQENTTAGETAENDGLVEITIPRGQSNEDPNYFVSVNGVNYLLPRGKKSRVPPHIAAEINRARAAEEAYFRKQEELIAEAGQ